MQTFIGIVIAIVGIIAICQLFKRDKLKADNEKKRRQVNNQTLQNINKIKPNTTIRRDGAKYRDYGNNCYSIALQGLLHRDNNAHKVARSLKKGQKLNLETDVNNSVDSNAVKVLSQSGVFLGFVPKEIAPKIKALIDSKAQIKCIVNSTSDGVIPFIWLSIHPKEIVSKSQPKAKYIYNYEDNGESSLFVDRLYDIDYNDPLFDDIEDIKEEDNDAMFSLTTDFLLDKINDNADLKAWYKDELKLKSYTDKFLIERVRQRVRHEGLSI